MAVPLQDIAPGKLCRLTAAPVPGTRVDARGEAHQQRQCEWPETEEDDQPAHERCDEE
jgi:hypothetical protein